jgi:hypothetical protein
MAVYNTCKFEEFHEQKTQPLLLSHSVQRYFLFYRKKISESVLTIIMMAVPGLTVVSRFRVFYWQFLMGLAYQYLRQSMPCLSIVLHAFSGVCLVLLASGDLS